MNDTQLKNWLENYAKKISLVENKKDQASEEEIIAILISRDLIHTILSERKYESTEYITQLVELDNRLRKQTKLINEKINLPELRKSFIQKSWWWFLEPPLEINFWNKYDRLWNFTSITLFIISLCILFDINSRIAADRPDVFGASLVVIQGLLTSFFAAIILTKDARELLSKLLKSWHVPIHFHQEVQLAGAVFLVLILILFRCSLPQISEHYYHIFRSKP